MNILFAHQKLMHFPFVRRDLEILRSAYEVEEFAFTGLRDVPRLWQATRRCDMTFSWFGKLHAFFAVMFSKMQGKKAVVVAGGDDVAREPGYGMFAYWWKRWCPLFVFKQADLILCVSEHTRQDAIRNAKANPAKCILLYHGFELDEYKPKPGVQKGDLALTVAGKITEASAAIKGMESFVRSSAFLPDVAFSIVGPWHDSSIDRFREEAPSNVKFLGGVYGDDLVKLYSLARVYVQASQHESFGCAVAEAMLCECVPVLARKGALPEVGGNAALYIDSLDPTEVAARIKEAMSHPEMGARARERIAALFPVERRRQELLHCIEGLLASSGNGNRKGSD